MTSAIRHVIVGDVTANGPMALPQLETPGSRIKFLRQSKHLTQESLARQLFTTQATIARWEGDKFVPNRQAQVLLAEALGTTRLFLFGEKVA